MKSIKFVGANLVVGVSIACFTALLCGVIWASGRSFEITDESYYLLSAIHPDAVQAYISAQHWTLAPLWKLSGSLIGFRLLGALILIGSASLLALGAMRVFMAQTDQSPSITKALPILATSSVFALLYVATIQPSPSYNLLAAASAYAAGGAVLLASNSKRRSLPYLFCALAGVCLAIGFVNKASAGISSAFVVLAWIIVFLPGLQKWLCIGLLSLAAALTVLGMASMQNAETGVLQNLQNGLTLFRQVQTEPVGERLIRYAVTLLSSIAQSVAIFSPALVLVGAALAFKRTWLAVFAVAGFVILISIGQHFLGGMHNYHLQLEPVYAVMLALAVIALAQLERPYVSLQRFRMLVLVLGLVALPYAVAVGTGNALFTQVIVSLAPWGVLAGLATVHIKPSLHDSAVILRQGLHILVVALITVQILTSYTRDPYHLAAPLNGQTTRASIGSFGVVRTDPGTAQMIADLERLKTTCDIVPGSSYLGLYNVPGLALLLDAVPPVSPWLNNAAQTDFVLDLWDRQNETKPIVLAITQRPDGTPYPLPKRLESAIVSSKLCGSIKVPFNNQTVEIHTVSKL